MSESTDLMVGLSCSASYNALMESAATHLLILVIASLFSAVVWLVAHQKQSEVHRSGARLILSRLNAATSKIIGWFITVVCGLCAIYYLVSIPFDLLGIKLGP